MTNIDNAINTHWLMPSISRARRWQRHSHQPLPTAGTECVCRLDEMGVHLTPTAVIRPEAESTASWWHGGRDVDAERRTTAGMR
jgi:hypothetical protein